jgi:hypothetical protein
VFVTYGIYDGFADIFQRVAADEGLRRLTTAIPSKGTPAGFR